MTDRSRSGSPGRVALADATVDDPAPVSIVPRLCPFLSSSDGDWRSAVATRDHRCTAVDPPAALSLEKQRRLCLGEGYAGCATFVAARRSLEARYAPDSAARDDASRASDDDGPASPDLPAPMRWAIPRTAPIVLDRGRPSVRLIVAQRSITQLGLVLLMALAFVVLALARLSADGRSRLEVSPSPGASVASASSAATSAAGPTASPSVVATASVLEPTSPSPGSSARPSSSAAPSPAPSAGRRYRVAAGDTLSGIAAHFGVSLKALEAANRISDPNHLKIGTILVIP